MKLFSSLFAHSSESVALIDIGSGSVGGGYVRYAKEKIPTLEYAARIPIKAHTGESLSAAMLRALEELNSLLIKEGAPALLRATGSGKARHILVAVASPWQETAIRIQRVEEEKPFTFTRTLMNDIVAKSAVHGEGRIASGESVIATMLNGYETNKPFGKKIKLADVVVLSSSIEGKVAESVREALRATYHTNDMSFAAFAPLAYAVFRDIYPHEKDFLVLDVSGEATDIAFVKQGLLIGVQRAEQGVRHLMSPHARMAAPSADAKEEKGAVHVIRETGDGKTNDAARAGWLASILEALRNLSKEHALPRTLFLLADEEAREYLKSALDDASLRSLWLSDEPLRVIPVVPAHFSQYLATGAAGKGDVFLMLLALYYRDRLDS